VALLTAVRPLIRTERPGGSAFGQLFAPARCGHPRWLIFTKLGLSAEQLSHRRVTAVLTFLRDAGLRG
jgi:hypothetical protein